MEACLYQTGKRVKPGRKGKEGETKEKNRRKTLWKKNCGSPQSEREGGNLHAFEEISFSKQERGEKPEVKSRASKKKNRAAIGPGRAGKGEASALSLIKKKNERRSVLEGKDMKGSMKNRKRAGNSGGNAKNVGGRQALASSQKSSPNMTEDNDSKRNLRRGKGMKQKIQAYSNPGKIQRKEGLPYLRKGPLVRPRRNASKNTFKEKGSMRNSGLHIEGGGAARL